MSETFPGNDEIVLAAPGSGVLCSSLACARAGRVAVVVVTYGVLNESGADYYDPRGLWRDQWGHSCSLCWECWEQTQQLVVKYRPFLVVTDSTSASATAESSGGRE